MFDERYATLEPFSIAHVSAMAVCFGIIALYMLFIKKIKLDRFYETVIAVVMLLNEAVFLIWQFSSYGAGVEHLPLHLCTISLYLNGISMLTGKRAVIRYTAIFSFVGACISIAVPMQGYTFPHFRYLHYYINHLLIALTSVYMLKETEGCNLKEALVSELVLFVFVLTVIHPVNIAFGTEFMFLSVSSGYFSTVFASRNIIVYIAAFAIHALLSFVYNQKVRKA